MQLTKKELADRIDLEILEAHTSDKEIETFCQQAKEYDFCAITVLPVHVPIVSKYLKGSKVKVDAAIGFYSGNLPTELKLKEVEWTVKSGADELDVLINISALRSGNLDVVESDLEKIIKAAGEKTVKVIVEVSLLTEKEIETACTLAKEVGAKFVSTSTGLMLLKKWRPTVVEDVTLLKQLLGDSIKVKATGGITTIGQTLALIKAGADRIGTSSGVKIIEDALGLRYLEYARFVKQNCS